MKNEKGTIVLAGGVIGLIAAILVFFGIRQIVASVLLLPERYHRCAGTSFSGSSSVYPSGDHWSGAWSMYHFTC